MNITESTLDVLIGPLNETEQKFAPKKVYTAGNTTMLQHGPRVSIVGSRKPSPEGVKRTAKLTRMLCERDVVIVSGLAMGIDTVAHTTALEVGGRTMAVLGTPLDTVTPKSNTELQHAIMRDHLALSQFANGSRVYRTNFPTRNRTMALISDVTIIMEAADDSGSLHQAWEALRLGRELFIPKSAADNPDLEWPAKVIHYGAWVLSDETIEDLYSVLPERSPIDDSAAVPI